MIFSESANRLFPQPMFETAKKVKELELQGKDFIHFEIGDPDFNCEYNIKSAVINSLHRYETHYTSPKGIPELIDAICNKHNVKPENVLITPGANIAIFYVLSCLCNPGDTVAIPNPGFPTYSLVAKYLGLELIFYNQVLNPKDVQYIDSKVTIINFPNNPTGLIYIEPRNYKFTIYDNIYFSYANYEGKMLNHDLIINIYSFSKMYAMTGFRLGYIIANPELINKMEILLNITNSCVPEFIQRAGIAALQTDNSAMVEEYRRRRDFLCEGLSKLPSIGISIPDGTFYAFPNISKTGLISKEFADKCLDAGVALLPGTDFGSNGEGHVRISYASTNIEKIKEGLRRIRSIL